MDRPDRLPVAALVRGGLALVAGLAFLLGAAIPAAAATSVPLAPVPLGIHRFGHLRMADTIVAHADPDEVGFSRPPPGADGISYGPWSFDVADDGSVWLLDEVNHRLLVWQPGQVDHPARTVPLPLDPLERIADFAVAPDHSIYATYVPPPGPGPKTLRLCKLSDRGRVLWTAATTDEIFNAQLRVGPDDALYVVGGSGGGGWTPLTTPAGRALPLADQRRRTGPAQPLPGGLRLTATHPTAGGEWRFTLADQTGQALRGWRVTSQTELGALGATPALVGGDPVVVLDLSRQTRSSFLYEYEVLRLARAGGTSLRFAITPASRAVWGDAPVTGVRVGPDGRLYQLRTSPTAGVSIASSSLTPVGHAPPTTAPTPAPSPTGPRVDNGGMTAPTGTLPPTQPTTPPADPAAARSALGRWLPGLAAVTASGLAGLGLWLLYRRRHPTGPGPQGRSRVAG